MFKMLIVSIAVCTMIYLMGYDSVVLIRAHHSIIPMLPGLSIYERLTTLCESYFTYGVPAAFFTYLFSHWFCSQSMCSIFSLAA